MCAVSVLLAILSDSCWAVAAGMGRAWFMKPARAKCSAAHPDSPWCGVGYGFRWPAVPL